MNSGLYRWESPNAEQRFNYRMAISCLEDANLLFYRSKVEIIPMYHTFGVHALMNAAVYAIKAGDYRVGRILLWASIGKILIPMKA